jgi:23S rRNA pseudouridine955/2504/2580 synthase
MRKPSSSRPAEGGRRARSRDGVKPKTPSRASGPKAAAAKPAGAKAKPRLAADKPLVHKFDVSSAKPSKSVKPAKEHKPEDKPADPVMLGVQNLTVLPDEAGMRIDRFLEARFPSLSFSHIQRMARKGELRVNSKRVETKDRLEAGQTVRVPPLSLEPKAPKRDGLSEKDRETRDFLASITLYEDEDMMVLNKPIGLAVQGGSGMVRHVDAMLEVLTDKQGQKPRLVHRLDRETSGCLVIAKNRFSASALAKSFRARDTRKIYWALVAGVPRVKQGRVSTFLAKGEDEEGDAKMVIARHGAEGASHAVTYYAVVETAGQKLAWLSMKPVTGRTHQLRAHAAHIGHPIVGDPKYFNVENWELPGGLQKKLHLLARRIVIPHPRSGKPVDITAPLPPHMKQSWSVLGFDASRYDPIEESPE